MNFELIGQNLLSPPILFFFLGILAVLIKSDLEIPQSVSKLFSLYLLFAIGFKGGTELAHSTINREIIISLGLAVFMAFLVPVYTFFILKKKLGVYDAGAIAATYGSISAVTFITAAAFLQSVGTPFGGHMVAGMALMESPAIIVGVFLIRFYTGDSSSGNGLTEVVKEALTNGSVVVILGSLFIGMMVSDKEQLALVPFTDHIFKGILTLFLLDMGLLAGKRIGALKKAGPSLVFFGILMPMFNAILGIIMSKVFGINLGDSLLLVILLASASYIAVPAAIRLTVPEANPGLYVPLSLAVTFPFNIIVGIPLYYYLLNLINF